MSEYQLRSLLTQVDFLQGCSAQDLDLLEGIASYCEFPGKSLVFREGDPATHCYVIVEGNISLEICSPGEGCHRVLTLSTGELLGWSPVLESGRFTVTARTMIATQMIAFPADKMILICEDNPRFGYEFMKRIAQSLAKRLTAARLQLINVYREHSSLSHDS